MPLHIQYMATITVTTVAGMDLIFQIPFTGDMPRSITTTGILQL